MSGLTRLLLYLANNQDIVRAAGVRARKALLEHYDLPVSMDRMAAIFSEDKGRFFPVESLYGSSPIADLSHSSTQLIRPVARHPELLIIGGFMIPMFALALCSFLLCLGLTPLFRDLFLRLGLVDRPDAERKVHLRAVPRIGGVPIALSYALALALVVYFSPGSSKLYIQHRELFRELLPAAGLIFLTGLIDDIFGLKPLQKLFGQFLAAVLAVSFGARIAFVHLPPWASFALSLFWLIGCTNAFNLIDGMDGLASGVSLIACVTTAGVAVVSGNTGLALATAPLAGALLAFLRYNFSPATVFLGDCGSLTIGFVLGCFSLIWSQHTTSFWGLAAPLMVIALPLIDVGLSISRRFIRQVPLLQGDRGHIHHMVLGLGFSTRGAAFVLYGVCGVGALLAVARNISWHQPRLAGAHPVLCAGPGGYRPAGIR